MSKKSTPIPFSTYWKEYLYKRIEELRYSSQKNNNVQLAKVGQELMDTMSPKQLELFDDYIELLIEQESDCDAFLYEEGFKDAFRWRKFFTEES